MGAYKTYQEYVQERMDEIKLTGNLRASRQKIVGDVIEKLPAGHDPKDLFAGNTQKGQSIRKKVMGGALKAPVAQPLDLDDLEKNLQDIGDGQ